MSKIIADNLECGSCGEVFHQLEGFIKHKMSNCTPSEDAEKMGPAKKPPTVNKTSWKGVSKMSKAIEKSKNRSLIPTKVTKSKKMLAMEMEEMLLMESDMPLMEMKQMKQDEENRRKRAREDSVSMEDSSEEEPRMCGACSGCTMKEDCMDCDMCMRKLEYPGMEGLCMQRECTGKEEGEVHEPKKILSKRFRCGEFEYLIEWNGHTKKMNDALAQAIVSKARATKNFSPPPLTTTKLASQTNSIVKDGERVFVMMPDGSMVEVNKAAKTPDAVKVTVEPLKRLVSKAKATPKQFSNAAKTPEPEAVKNPEPPTKLTLKASATPKQFSNAGKTPEAVKVTEPPKKLTLKAKLTPKQFRNAAKTPEAVKDPEPPTKLKLQAKVTPKQFSNASKTPEAVKVTEPLKKLTPMAKATPENFSKAAKMPETVKITELLKKLTPKAKATPEQLHNSAKIREAVQITELLKKLTSKAKATPKQVANKAQSISLEDCTADSVDDSSKMLKLPNTLQLVQSELPLSEAKNNAKLIGMYLFRQVISPNDPSQCCLLCPTKTTFSSLADLEKHYSGVHDLTLETFKAEFSENTVFMSVPSGVTYQTALDLGCNLCDLTLKNLSEVRFHYPTSHSKEVRLVQDQQVVELSTSLFCSICSQMSSSFDAHHEHMKKVHRMQTYVCKFCMFITSKANRLKTHVRQKHAQATGPPDVPTPRAVGSKGSKIRLKCPMCQTFINGKVNLDQHILLVHSVQTDLPDVATPEAVETPHREQSKSSGVIESSQLDHSTSRVVTEVT